MDDVKLKKIIYNTYNYLREYKRHIVWFSCGAASAIMSKIVREEVYGSQLVYCDTGGEHPDNEIFLNDVEVWLDTKVKRLQNYKYENHFDVIRKTRYVNGKAGARCTVELKKKLRFEFQLPDDVKYFGYTIEEKHRAERFTEAYPEVDARFPLIEKGLTKEECVGLLLKNNIKIPTMYALGFNNNNCIPCVKGGAGYFNKIRKFFPEKFNQMAKLEREVGASCLNGVYLDELDPKAGRHKDLIIQCDFVCQSMEEL